MADRDNQIALQALSRHPTEPEHTHNTQDETPDYYARDTPLNANSAHVDHDELPAYSRAAPRTQALGDGHSTTLHRSAFVPYVTVLFLVLIIYSWVVLAILSFRPISTPSWEANTNNNGLRRYPNKLNYATDERIYRSAMVLQSIASVLILPWTSAVCAYAAVIFVQNRKDALSMTMRQVMNLADRRWLDLSLIGDLMEGSWKQHGSHFLAFAILVHFVALVLYPIQLIVVTPTNRHVPTYLSEMGEIVDLAYMDSDYDSSAGSDVVQTRNALVGADKHTWQPKLWESGGPQKLSTLYNISELNDAFFSPLPNSFSGGVLREYAPRINSSTTVRVIEADEYPSSCSSDTGLFAHYSSVYDYYPGSTYSMSYNWTISACMLSSNLTSPWSSTRDRQDFYEILYINATIPDSSYLSSNLKDGKLLEIKMDTTAGYFELPNYMNNQTAGPLHDTDPTRGCKKGDFGCIRQDSRYYYSYDRKVRRQSGSSDNSTITTNQTLPWNSMFVENKGPLLTTALAIFGPGSFLNTFMSQYDQLRLDMAASDVTRSASVDNTFCIAVAPLTNVVSASGSLYRYSTDTCIEARLTETGRYYSSDNSHNMVQSWLVSLFSNSNRLANAMNVAGFLANKRLIEAQSATYTIFQDLGSEMAFPKSSVAGLAVASVFMGLYVLMLLALSFYGFQYPRWASQLDSWAMLRSGAAYGNSIFPMLVSYNSRDVKELDEVPGVIRDIGSVADDAVIPISRLGFGEGKPLRGGHRYECYKGDNKPLTLLEANKIRRGG